MLRGANDPDVDDDDVSDDPYALEFDAISQEIKTLFAIEAVNFSHGVLTSLTITMGGRTVVRGDSRAMEPRWTTTG